MCCGASRSGVICVLEAVFLRRGETSGKRSRGYEPRDIFPCESVNTDSNTFGIQGMIKEGKMIRKQKRK